MLCGCENDGENVMLSDDDVMDDDLMCESDDVSDENGGVSE